MQNIRFLLAESSTPVYDTDIRRLPCSESHSMSSRPNDLCLSSANLDFTNPLPVLPPGQERKPLGPWRSRLSANHPLQRTVCHANMEHHERAISFRSDDATRVRWDGSLSVNAGTAFLALRTQDLEEYVLTHMTASGICFVHDDSYTVLSTFPSNIDVIDYQP